MHRNLSREQKFCIVQECFGGPQGETGPQAPFNDKSVEFQPANISALYGVSLYNIQTWLDKINVIGREKFLSKSQSLTFSKAERMKILYEASMTGSEAISRKYDVGEITLEYWSRRYKLLGEKGLEFRLGHTDKYTSEEKVKIVQCYQINGIEQAVNKYGLRKRSIRRWREQIKEAGGPVEYLAKSYTTEREKSKKQIEKEKRAAQRPGKERVKGKETEDPEKDSGVGEGKEIANGGQLGNKDKTNGDIKQRKVGKVINKYKKYKNKSSQNKRKNKRPKPEEVKYFEENYDSFSSNEMSLSELGEYCKQQKEGLMSLFPNKLEGIENYYPIQFNLSSKDEQIVTNDDFDRDSSSIKNEELKSDLMRGIDPLLLKKMDIVRGYIDPYILDELPVTTDGEYDLAHERRLDIEKQHEDILDCTFMLKASTIELMQPLQYCIFTTLLDEMLLNFVQMPPSFK